MVGAVRDSHLIRKCKVGKEPGSIKALDFSSKPLNQWSQDEVLNWVRIGSMNRESYFSEAKRLSVADACVDGELLAATLQVKRSIDAQLWFDLFLFFCRYDTNDFNPHSARAFTRVPIPLRFLDLSAHKNNATYVSHLCKYYVHFLIATKTG
jgi:hypothetical protein